MLDKLEYRVGHTLLPWVKAELNRHYDFQCCESIEAFQRATGRAMTKSRHIKSIDRRHDKNDRDDATNRRRFVLGWDNREKKKRLATELEQLILQERSVQADLDRHNESVLTGQDRLAALGQIAETTEFSAIDVERHETLIRALEREREEIEANSNTIGVLKQRLALCQAREAALGEARDDTLREERSCEQHITQAHKLIANAKADLHHREQSGSLARDREAFDALELRIAADPLTVDTIFDCREAFRINQDQLLARLRESLEPLKNRLIDAMHRFARTFADENDLRPAIEYLDGFLDLRRRIAEEDLPRHEQRFKERLNEKVIQEIGLFRGELDTERRAIEDKIDTLNQSLCQLQYRPGTHIRLEARPVRDPEIVEFQTRLRQCIDGSFDDSDAGNEARFLKIQELLERLQDENNRRWRDKVTDVRRWFDFVAAVVDNESSKTQSIYQDSSGQSGGEKAKLAFTILVAAIAYQYDLEPGQPAADRFQFVVVDEMFSKVDDQHAEYALNLFRQFGLQLLIVAPLDAKARVTQPYVGCYLYVDKRDSRSEMFEMTAREFDATLIQGQHRLGASTMGTLDAF